ncbi:MAG: transposase zinc-binding domain-containing protein [Myxococcales bacterium]|nr:transposase zinc-binding domain-containing protein [Myxococcales bacterium]
MRDRHADCARASCPSSRRIRGAGRRRAPCTGSCAKTCARSTKPRSTASPRRCPASYARSLEGYVDCGILARGFSVLACCDCRKQKAVAFSCKGRAFCPACLGRRMAAGAADLVDHILPNDAPLRQFVLTLPFELRARLAYDAKLLGAVSRTFVDSVLGWYRHKMRDRGIKGGKSGAVTAVQRVSSDFRLNPHFHTLGLDGVFAEEAGELAFHALPFLTNDDVADVLQIARTRIIALLRRKGVISDDDESGASVVTADATLADTEPALAGARSGVHPGRRSASPALHRRDPIKLRADSELMHTKALCAAEHGFTLHAATTASAGDTAGERPSASTSCARRSPRIASSSSPTTW